MSCTLVVFKARVLRLAGSFRGLEISSRGDGRAREEAVKTKRTKLPRIRKRTNIPTV